MPIYYATESVLSCYLVVITALENFLLVFFHHILSEHIEQLLCHFLYDRIRGKRRTAENRFEVLCFIDGFGIVDNEAKEAYLLVECYGFLFQGSIKPLPVQNIYLVLTIGKRYAHKTVVILGQLTGIKNDIAFERRNAELEERFESLAVDIVCHDIFPPKYLLR